MYKHILLAYDGSREGRLALREGAREFQTWIRTFDGAVVHRVRFPAEFAPSQAPAGKPASTAAKFPFRHRFADHVFRSLLPCVAHFCETSSTRGIDRLDAGQLLEAGETDLLGRPQQARERHARPGGDARAV